MIINKKFLSKLAKQLLIVNCSLLISFAANAANEDPFQFENFAIVESADADINIDAVAMDLNAASVNVGGFDIAGVFLGMPFEDVQTLFFKTKYLYTPRREHSIIYTIHPDWKYNLDYECRMGGTIIPTELEKCINTLARARGLLYASELHLVRDETGETVTVYFTSNATDNVVWRVVYNNDVNEIEGAAEKFANQREKKILAFWQGVLDKYGAPNSDGDKWLTSSNAYDPMMTAYYGSLDLVDQGRMANDSARNVADAHDNFQSKPYAF